jgi:hypothetical protein
MCVNVGRPLEHTWNARQKSENGAVWVPAELLEIKPYQRMNAQLAPVLTASMINVALREPAHHVRLIVEEGLDILRIRPAGAQTTPNTGVQPTPTPAAVSRRQKSNGQSIMLISTKQNMPESSIDDGLIDVPANFLQVPHLRCQKHTQKTPGGPLHFKLATAISQTTSWNLTNTRFYRPGNIDFLNVYDLNHFVWESRQSDLIRDMTNRLQYYGLKITQGTFLSGHVDAMDSFWRDTSKAKGGKTTLIAMEEVTVYAKIKRKADIDFGVQTVCILMHKVGYYPKERGWQQQGYQNQQLDNLALKFNMKTGGYNFTFEPAMLQRLLGADRDTIIVLGADVGHPPIGSFQRVPVLLQLCELRQSVLKLSGIDAAAGWGSRGKMIRRRCIAHTDA